MKKAVKGCPAVRFRAILPVSSPNSSLSLKPFPNLKLLVNHFSNTKPEKTNDLELKTNDLL